MVLDESKKEKQDLRATSERNEKQDDKLNGIFLNRWSNRERSNDDGGEEEKASRENMINKKVDEKFNHSNGMGKGKTQ